MLLVFNENRKDGAWRGVTGVWRSDCGARVLNGTIPVPIFGTVEDASTNMLRVRHTVPFSGSDYRRTELFRVSRCDKPNNCIKDYTDVERSPEYWTHYRHLKPDPDPMIFEMTETSTGRVVECEATEFSKDTICGSYASVDPFDHGSFVLRFGNGFSAWTRGEHSG